LYVAYQEKVLKFSNRYFIRLPYNN